MYARRVATLAVACTIGAAGNAAPAAQESQGASSAVHAFDFWPESEPLEFPNRTAETICADLDGDGFPELVRLGIAYGNAHGGTLGITRGGSYGMHGPELQVHRTSSPQHALAQDVNGDGLVDLIVTHLEALPGSATAFTRNATLFVQTGASTGSRIDFVQPRPTVVLAPGGQRVLLVDVDRDRVADLVSVGTAHQLYYQKGLGAAPGEPLVPRFAAQPTSISALAAQSAGLPPGSYFGFGLANDLVSGDFDGDGSTDLAVAAGSAFGGGVHVYFQRPAGWVYQGFETAVSGGVGTESITSLAVGDLDGDGFTDLAATSPNLELTTLLNNGFAGARPGLASSVGMTSVRSPGIGEGWSGALAADLNGDSLADLAFLDAEREVVSVLYNPANASAPGVFSGAPAFHATFDFAGSAARSLHAADVDGDDDFDLVTSFLFSRSTSILFNQSLANARKPLTVARLRGARSSVAPSSVFVPDTLEYVQRPAAGAANPVAADLFTFQATAAPGDELRLRVRLRARDSGVLVRVGLLDPVTKRVRWALAARPDAVSREFTVNVPHARQFVSANGRVEVCVASSRGGQPFRTAIDQLSAEVLR